MKNEKLLKKISEGRQYRPMMEVLRAKTDEEEPKEAEETEEDSTEESKEEEKEEKAKETEEDSKEETPSESNTEEEEEPKEEKTERMIVAGHACTFNQPYTLYDDGEYRVDEQIDPAAFEACDMGDVIFQYNHEGRVFARTRNNTLAVRTNEHGLYIEADLSGTEEGRKLFQEIRDGYTDRMSFGFTVSEDRVEETEGMEEGQYRILRTITRVGKLYDVSAVSLPANDATDISARSFCDGLIAEIKAERQSALKNKCMALLNL